MLPSSSISMVMSLTTHVIDCAITLPYLCHCTTNNSSAAHSSVQHQHCLALTLTTYEHPHLSDTYLPVRTLNAPSQEGMTTTQLPTITTEMTTRGYRDPSTIHMTFLTSQGCTAVSIDTYTALARFINHFL